MEYLCEKCNMKIKNLVCGHCHSELQHKTIQSSQGSEVKVSECPKNCGRIKSPMCCGQDMTFISK